jgi:ABC-type multidrug transport system fused ATPase/permease subunit
VALVEALFGMLAMYVVVYRIFSPRIWRATWRSRALYDEIGGRLQETVAGVRQVRIYNRESAETESLVERTATSLDRAFATGVSAVSLSTACQAIAGFGSTLIVFLGARHVISGDMSYGDLLAFNQYLWFVINPTVNLTNVGGMMSEVMVSAARVSEILAAEPKVRSKPGAVRISGGKGLVEIRDVCFSYVKGEPVIRNISLTVEPGMAVALVGPTGCGKTTLTSLIMRHWDVDSGAILVDGWDVRDVDLGSLRRLVGVVPQSPVLFEGTLAENIAYGRPDAPRGDIEEAARTAELAELVRSLPDGLDTVLGTRGVKLSVGEKQRVAIARAVATDPRILIMDEATSALDSESEALIQKSLARVLKGRTSFIIAHRLSTVTRCDLIAVMEAGRIVETGSHAELLAREGGLYRELYRRLLSQEAPGDPGQPAGGGP